MSPTDLGVALFRTSREGVLILGRTCDELVVEAVRTALLIEGEAELVRLSRDDARPQSSSPHPKDAKG